MESTHSPKVVRAAAKRLVDWYWSEGVKRKGGHALSTGSWLNTSYHALKIAERFESLPSSARRVLGIWGPSQSGKSTFLSRVIDQPYGEMRSALQWSASAPVELVGSGKDTIKLNPYNFQRDGSGCVTRYSLESAVLDTEYPVELVFAKPEQLLQAFAIGYLTECDGGWDGVIWTGPLLIARLEKATGTGTKKREAFELLHDFVLVVDDLILARWPRYASLKSVWPTLRSKTADWADEFGAVWIVTGPIIDGGKPKAYLGEKSKKEMLIAIPDALFKIVVRESGIPNRPIVLAFRFPQKHVKYLSKPYDLAYFLVTVDEIEKATGLDFLSSLPDDVEADIESKRVVALWK